MYVPKPAIIAKENKKQKTKNKKMEPPSGRENLPTY